MILQWAIIIRCLFSWIPVSFNNSIVKTIVKLIYDVTEPILKPFRLIRLGGAGAMIDLSPVFAILALELIRSIVLNPLFNLLARIV